MTKPKMINILLMIAVSVCATLSVKNPSNQAAFIQATGAVVAAYVSKK